MLKFFRVEFSILRLIFLLECSSHVPDINVGILKNNNIVINAYRDGDGTYKIYPLALKSDLNQNIIAKTFDVQVTVKANEGYICDVPFTVPDGYEVLDAVDAYIKGTPAALCQQDIIGNKIRVYVQPFYGGTGNVYVKVLFKKKS